MKRIAILLAAVGLGSGCVVSSNPCERTLNVDWYLSFISAGGTSGLSCAGAGVDNVDVYIDGVQVALARPCTNYVASFAGYDDNSHHVVVEGFSGTTIINRDWYTVPAGCGDATFLAAPGSGTLEILPDVCEAFTTYLTYHLADVTFGSPGTLISSVLPGGSKPYTCAGGISFPVPYGDYDLVQIEETNSAGNIVYAAKCTPTTADVPASGITTIPVSLSVSSVGCTW